MPICMRCGCRFGDLTVQLSWWRRYRIYGCRRCQALEPRFEGVERLVLFLDGRLADQEASPRLDHGTLYISWYAVQRPVDVDVLVVGQVSNYQLKEFIIRWGEWEDEVQRAQRRRVPVYLLPEADLNLNSRNLLKEWFTPAQPALEALAPGLPFLREKGETR